MGLLFVALSIVMLKRLVINSRSMSIMATLPAVALVAAAVAANGFDYQSPDFPVTIQEHILLFFLGVVSISITLFLNVLLLGYIVKRNYSIGILVCLLSIPSIYMLVSFASHEIRATNYVENQKEAIKDISFQVYQPMYMPSSYRLNGHGLVQGATIYTGSNPRKLYEPAHYDFRYIYPFSYDQAGRSDVPEAYTVYEYAASTDYNPPKDCGGTMTIIRVAGRTVGGVDTYGDRDRPCELVGRLASGCDVYYEEYSRKVGIYEQTSLYGYCKLNDTVIVITTDNQYSGTQNAPQKSEMIKIFDSLQPLTPQQLQDHALKNAESRN